MSVLALDQVLYGHVLDIEKYKNYLVVSSNKKYLIIYQDGKIINQVLLDVSITKLTACDDVLVGISFSNCKIIVFDERFKIIESKTDIFQPYICQRYKDFIVVGCMDKSVLFFQLNLNCLETARHEILMENKTLKDIAGAPCDVNVFGSKEIVNDSKMYDHSNSINDCNIDVNKSIGAPIINYETVSPGDDNSHILKIKTKICISKLLTAISQLNDDLVLAMQQDLCIFNSEFILKYSKTLPSCINSVGCLGGLIIAGLMSGKIFVETLQEQEDSFIFNAHFVSNESEKIMYPVSQIRAQPKFVASSGFDGKIILWDIEQKKQAAIALQCKGMIRKFVLLKESIFALTESSLNEDADALIIFQQIAKDLIV